MYFRNVPGILCCVASGVSLPPIGASDDDATAAVAEGADADEDEGEMEVAVKVGCKAETPAEATIELGVEVAIDACLKVEAIVQVGAMPVAGIGTGK